MTLLPLTVHSAGLPIVASHRAVNLNSCYSFGSEAKVLFICDLFLFLCDNLNPPHWLQLSQVASSPSFQRNPSLLLGTGAQPATPAEKVWSRTFSKWIHLYLLPISLCQVALMATKLADCFVVKNIILWFMCVFTSNLMIIPVKGHAHCLNFQFRVIDA